MHHYSQNKQHSENTAIALLENPYLWWNNCHPLRRPAKTVKQNTLWLHFRGKGVNYFVFVRSIRLSWLKAFSPSSSVCSSWKRPYSLSLFYMWLCRYDVCPWKRPWLALQSWWWQREQHSGYTAAPLWTIQRSTSAWYDGTIVVMWVWGFPWVTIIKLPIMNHQLFCCKYGGIGAVQKSHSAMKKIQLN